MLGFLGQGSGQETLLLTQQNRHCQRPGHPTSQAVTAALKLLKVAWQVSLERVMGIMAAVTLKPMLEGVRHKGQTCSGQGVGEQGRESLEVG